jgi:hypothetical protein
MRRQHLDALFLFKFIVVLNSVLPFWKMFAYEFLLGASEILPCSVSAPQADIVPLIDALHLLMLFARVLTYLEPNLFSINISYEFNHYYY